jgi:SPP1 family predicted phage head-tail adaptor
MKPIGAGDLRDRVTVSSPSFSTSAQGGRTTTWSDVASSIAAKIETSTQSEQLAGGQVKAILTHRVIVRYTATLAAAAASWRITWGTRTLQVQAIENIESRNAFLAFLCREVQA